VQWRTHRVANRRGGTMASIQRIVSPLTNTVAYRVQVGVKGQRAQSEIFPNRKEAEQWATSIEARSRRSRQTESRSRETSWGRRNSHAVSLRKRGPQARSCRRRSTSGAAVNRYVATLSHLFSFAVKERRLLDRNPVSDISRKREPRGRTRFLSDGERGSLLDACAKSDWAALHALALLAMTTGARKGELIGLK